MVSNRLKVQYCLEENLVSLPYYLLLLQVSLVSLILSSLMHIEEKYHLHHLGSHSCQLRTVYVPR